MSFWSFLGGIGSALLGSRSNNNALQAQIADSHGSRVFAKDMYYEQMKHMLGTYDAANVRYRHGSVDQIGRDRDVQQSRDTMRAGFETGAEFGLTPTEIAGSPVPGGTSTSGGNATLGNNMAAANQARMSAHNAAADRTAMLRGKQMDMMSQLGTAAIQAGVGFGQQATQRRGQDVQMSQTELQTATQKEVSRLVSEANIKSSKIAAAAQTTAARISANASKYVADVGARSALNRLKLDRLVSSHQVSKISAETSILLQKHDQDKVLFDERWYRTAAQMGPENFLTSALALYHDVDPEAVLKGLSSVDRKALEAYAEQILSRQSWLRKEGAGAGALGSNFMENFGQTQLGSGIDAIGDLFSGRRAVGR
jgi:hypothetical protein